MSEWRDARPDDSGKYAYIERLPIDAPPTLLTMYSANDKVSWSYWTPSGWAPLHSRVCVCERPGDEAVPQFLGECKDCVRVELKHEPRDVMFRAGMLAAREFERFGAPSIALAARSNWWPSVGVDPCRETADDACAEAIGIAMAFVEKNGAARE